MPGPETISVVNQHLAYKSKIWPKNTMEEMVYENSPILGLFPKHTDLVEKVRALPVGYTDPQGIGPTFAGAKASKTAMKQQEWNISVRQYYGTFSIDGEVMRRTKYGGNKTEVVNHLDRHYRGILRQLKNDYSSYMHGNGGGALGRLTAASNPATATITLTKGADRRRIGVGMTLNTAATDGTSGAVNAGEVVVLGLGGTESAPTVTVSGASWQAGIPGCLASDFVFRKDCFGNVFKGLDGWFPNWSPSALPGTFNNVNRDLDPPKFAGQVFDGRGMQIEQRIYHAALLSCDAGFSPDTYLMSTRNYENLKNELTASGKRGFDTEISAAPIQGVKTGLKYNAVKVQGPNSLISVVACPWMPDDVERCLPKDIFSIESMGPMIQDAIDATKNAPMIEEAADAYEVRIVSYVATQCETPWGAVRVQVA